MLLPKLPTQLELIVVRDHILLELQKSHLGHASELSWLAQTTNVSDISNAGQTQIIVIGGTTIRSKIFKQGGISASTEATLPRLGTKSDLISEIITFLDPITTTVIINFAFPIQPTIRKGKLDGILIRGSKNHQLFGLIGKLVGEEIEASIGQERNQTISVHLFSDIYGLLLRPQSLVAGIVGTGINMGIKDTHSKSIINLEAANTSVFPRIESSHYVDTHSLNPGKHLFEKEIGGGYLWQHYNYWATKSNLPSITSTTEFSEQTETSQQYLAQTLLLRSAYLFSALLGATYNFIGGKKLDCIMEGSVFWEVGEYQTYVQQGLALQGFDPTNITFSKPASVFEGSETLIEH
jgi:hypothetical protein